MNVFVLAILIYLLYRFIAGFLIPVIRTTSHVRQQFNNMNKPPEEGPTQNPPPPGFGGQSAQGQRQTPSDPAKLQGLQKWENTLILRKSSEFKPQV